jgi:hypothetical protein
LVLAVGLVVLESAPAAATKLYWSVLFDRIESADEDGGNRRGLVFGVGIVHGIALDLTARRMYWTNVHGQQGIFRSRLDGSDVETLVTSGLIAPSGLALHVAGGKMYWTDLETGKIQRANLDGSGVEDLVTGLSEPFAIALDISAGRMVWTDRSTDKIQSADLDGTDQLDLLAGLGEPTALALDLIADKMYWCEKAPPRIRRAGLDGSGVENLVTSGLASPLGLALDRRAGRMYWTNSDMSLALPSKIQRAALDGTGVSDVLTFPSGFYPVALALDPQIVLDVPTASGWSLALLGLAIIAAGMLLLRASSRHAAGH